MSDEIMNAQTGQSGDLTENAVQPNVTGFQQASNNAFSNQSPEVSWEDREKDFLAKAFQQTQRMISQSENRQTSKYQGMIDQFKANYGVTLTEEQAQAMAQNQASKSLPNVQAPAQAPVQQAPAVDPMYQGFLYYHGIQRDSPVFHQVFNIQRTLGVDLDKTDEEYQKLTHPTEKYKDTNAFVDAWKQACLDKMVRLKNAQQSDDSKPNTNLGQMPLVGSKGQKANNYDPKRTAKSYFSEYMKDKKL